MNNQFKANFLFFSILAFALVLNSCTSTENTHRKQLNSYIFKPDQTILYQKQDLPFQFRYSPAFQIVHEAVADTFGWSRISSSIGKGRLIVQLKLSSSFQPKTNLEKTTFTVGRSGAPKQLKKCMQKQSDGYVAQADSIQKHGRIYYRTLNGGVATGHQSVTIQYRTIYKNYCYSIEERVFSTTYRNKMKISRFDSAKVWGALDAIWQSFHFKE